MIVIAPKSSGYFYQPCLLIIFIYMPSNAYREHLQILDLYRGLPMKSVALAQHRVRLLKMTEVDMFKLCTCVVIMIFLSLAGCGVRYNWVPQSDDPGPPNVDY